MSNYLAVATVTATLSRALTAAVAADVPGATVTTLRPDDSTNGTPATGVNIYLYQVAPNAAWRNTDLPTRSDDGGLIRRPRVALDLLYLMSFYGNEVQLEPQRLLGSVVRMLHTRPVLTRQMIRDAISDPNNAFLATSNLDEEVAEQIKLTPSTDNRTKLRFQSWSSSPRRAGWSANWPTSSVVPFSCGKIWRSSSQSARGDFRIPWILIR